MKKRKFQYTKPHTIEIKQAKFNKDQISVGGNTAVYLDGKLLRKCRRISLDIEARRPAMVTIEMYALVKSKTTNRLKRTKNTPSGFETYDKKGISLYELTNYFSTGTGRKSK